MSVPDSLDLMKNAQSFKDFINTIVRVANLPDGRKQRVKGLVDSPEAKKDYEEARAMAGLPAHRRAKSKGAHAGNPEEGSNGDSSQ